VRDVQQQIEDILVLVVFAGFQFVLLWMPERWDLQAASFTLWFFLFLVRSLLRGLVAAVTA
jgi:hypothetical protein